MTIIARHDTGSLAEWQSSNDSIARSITSLLAHLPQMPSAVGQLVTLNCQRAALASLRGEAGEDEVCASICLGAAGGAATFLAAQWDNGHVRAALGGEEIVFAATGANSLASVPAWLSAFSLALIARDPASLAVICDEEAIRAGERSSTEVDPFWSPLLRGLAALWLDDLALWADFSAETQQLLQPAFFEIASPDYVRALVSPLLILGDALASADQAAWQKAMLDALEAHRLYYGRQENRYDQLGFLAFCLLGLAALAHDRGLTTAVTSDYLPQYLVQGQCRSDSQKAADYLIAEPRSVAEAYLFMMLRGCTPTPEDHRLFAIDDLLVSVYECAGNDEAPARRFAFIAPENDAEPSDQIGDDRPSTLIDAGEFLWLADEASKRAPADARGLSPDAQQARRADLRQAIACVREVLKFIPPGADRVPASACWTDFSRELYQEDPGRFGSERLAATLSAWQRLLGEEPATAPDGVPDPRTRTLIALETIKAQVRPLLESLPDAGAGELAAALQPGFADYEQVFQGVDLAWLQRQYDSLWRSGLELKVAQDQTEVQIVAAPAGMLAEENELSRRFPGGYRKAADYLNPHRIWVAWKYLRPGEGAGMAFDGLVWIDDHWVWFPKPYRLIGRWLMTSQGKE